MILFIGSLPRRCLDQHTIFFLETSNRYYNGRIYSHRVPQRVNAWYMTQFKGDVLDHTSCIQVSYGIPMDCCVI